MPKETEIKIRMNDESLLEHVIDRCNKLGQLVQEQILQRDEYYDKIGRASCRERV